VPTKFTQVIQLFPTWEMTMKAVGATAPGHGSSWYNTTMVHITPVRTYADSLQGSPSPSTSSMTDTEGSGRMTRWGDGNGGDLRNPPGLWPGRTGRTKTETVAGNVYYRMELSS
jgi:hypothetical protein